MSHSLKLHYIRKTHFVIKESIRKKTAHIISQTIVKSHHTSQAYTKHNVKIKHSRINFRLGNKTVRKCSPLYCATFVTVLHTQTRTEFKNIMLKHWSVKHFYDDCQFKYKISYLYLKTKKLK